MASQVARARDLAADDHTAYRRLVAAYIDRLTEVAQEEDRLREMMHAFGRYLRREGVQPQHIVICAREAIQHARLREHVHERELAKHAVKWTIEGYYVERDARSVD